jgi:hypothetical protein
MSFVSYFTYRIKPDMKTSKEMLVIGTGFQNLIDSYFWYLPFASVRQCKYVMEQSKIPEDEWMAKRAALGEEHNTPGARDALKDGLKAWLRTDLFKQRRGKEVVLPKSTQSMVLPD